MDFGADILIGYPLFGIGRSSLDSFPEFILGFILARIAAVNMWKNIAYISIASPVHLPSTFYVG